MLLGYLEEAVVSLVVAVAEDILVEDSLAVVLVQVV